MAAESVLNLVNLTSRIYMIVRSELASRDQTLADNIKLSGKVTVMTDYSVEKVNGNEFVGVH